VIIGKLVEVNDEKNIVIEKDKGEKVNVYRSNIAKAKLHVEV
jgi:ribosome maturation factor RimP